MNSSNPTTGKPTPEGNYTPTQEMTYEQAFEELEAIVSALESNERTLAEAMALYQRGQELARYCTQQLDQAELKIQKISEGELVTADF